jgi:hypothetical protein
MRHLKERIGAFIRHRVAPIITLVFIANYSASALENSCFDDESLSKLLQNSLVERGAVIYVWSPRMVYSVHNMATAARAASAAGLDFVALHDMRVPPSELPPPRAASQALCSQQLIEREALRHLPTAFVIHAGQLHPYPVVGAMPLSAWQGSLNQRLARSEPQP